MKIDLSGKTAVVTGSTNGIGLACVRGLAAAGANVVVNGRKDTTVGPVVERLRSEFPAIDVQGVAADLGDAQGAAKIIAAVTACDILVNNVAGVVMTDALETPDDVYFKLYELNFMSSLRLSRAYLPGMLKRDTGRIIFNGAQQALMASRKGTAYAISKMAQLNLARSLAELTRGKGVTVNTVMIGPTHSATMDKILDNCAQDLGKTPSVREQEFIQSVAPLSLLQRLVTPEEVANFVVYLSSPMALATNGTVLSVEGGSRDGVL